tara:strand:+ start:956 stop:1129 length:174 start_codon:yes stop_codon:yes gene_type:complete
MRTVKHKEVEDSKQNIFIEIKEIDEIDGIDMEYWKIKWIKRMTYTCLDIRDWFGYKK